MPERQIPRSTEAMRSEQHEDNHSSDEGPPVLAGLTVLVLRVFAFASLASFLLVGQSVFGLSGVATVIFGIGTAVWWLAAAEVLGALLRIERNVSSRS